MTFLGSQGYAQAAVNLTLAGSIAGLSVVSGTLTNNPPLSGSMVGSSAGIASVSGTLNGLSAGLSGAIQGAATVSGQLMGWGALQGSAAGIATCSVTNDPCAGFVSQPGWLTVDQLASLQEVVLLSLPFRCTVLKNTPVSTDEQGNPIDNWLGIACYNCDIEGLQMLSETVNGSQYVATGLFLVTLPWNASVRPEYRLSIKSVVYEVENRGENLTDQACVQVTTRRVGS